MEIVEYKIMQARNLNQPGVVKDGIHVYILILSSLYIHIYAVSLYLNQTIIYSSHQCLPPTNPG